MKFRKLSVNSLPRVMVNLLAQEDEGVVVFAEAMNECAEMKTWFIATKTQPIDTEVRNDDSSEIQELRVRRELSKFFRALLDLSKPSRAFFVKDFDRLLNELGSQDFWGTEGQCDPRRRAEGYRFRQAARP